MNQSGLQQVLADLGIYNGVIDGLFGQKSKEAFISALASGPDTPVTDADVIAAAAGLGCSPAAIRAVWSVEAAGAGFQDGLPKILPEPHRFSKLTAHRFDAAHPDVSYPVWDKSKYPKTQQARYEQLAEMVSLDVEAGLQAASYGAFQIMGENFAMCGYNSPWAMVWDMSRTEGAQLQAFISFVRAKHLDDELRAENFDDFAAGYNGSAWRLNNYGARLRDAYKAAGGV